MSHLSVPILTIITGEGGSGGALALAVGNRVWMMEHSIYSILSPEGFASILWKDSRRSGEAADLMKLTARDLLKLGVIDGVISETGETEILPSSLIIKNLQNTIEKSLKELSTLSQAELQEQRLARFRKY